MSTVPNLRGPTLFAIGWIPCRSIRSHLTGAYAEQSGVLSKLALKLVFISGNDPPPDSFDRYEDLQEFIRKKDFRSIMGFHNVVYPDDVPWRPPPESHELLAVPGYTAYRLPFNLGRFGRRLAHFSEGDEFQASSFTRDRTRTFLPLEKTIHFRIGRFGNRVSRKLTGHNAPLVAPALDDLARRPKRPVVVLLRRRDRITAKIPPGVRVPYLQTERDQFTAGDLVFRVRPLRGQSLRDTPLRGLPHRGRRHTPDRTDLHQLPPLPPVSQPRRDHPVAHPASLRGVEAGRKQRRRRGSGILDTQPTSSGSSPSLAASFRQKD